MDTPMLVLGRALYLESRQGLPVSNEKDVLEFRTAHGAPGSNPRAWGSTVTNRLAATTILENSAFIGEGWIGEGSSEWDAMRMP